MSEERWVTIKGRHVLIGEDGKIKDKKIRAEIEGEESESSGPPTPKEMAERNLENIARWAREAAARDDPNGSWQKLMKDPTTREAQEKAYNAGVRAAKAARRAAGLPDPEEMKKMDKIADEAIEMIKKDFGQIEIDFDDETSKGGLDLWFRSFPWEPDEGEDMPHRLGWDLDPILDKLRTKYPNYTFNLMDPDSDEGFEFIRIEPTAEYRAHRENIRGIVSNLRN